MVISVKMKHTGLKAAYKAISFAEYIGRGTPLRGPLLDLHRTVSAAKDKTEELVGLNRLSPDQATHEFSSLLSDFYREVTVFQGVLEDSARSLEKGRISKFEQSYLTQIEKSASELKAINDRIDLINLRFIGDTHAESMILNDSLKNVCQKFGADRAAVYLDNGWRDYRTYYFWGFSPQQSLHFMKNEVRINSVLFGSNKIGNGPLSEPQKEMMDELGVTGAHIEELLLLFKNLRNGVKLYLFRNSSDFSIQERRKINSAVFVSEAEEPEQIFTPFLEHLDSRYSETARQIKRARHSSAIDESKRDYIPSAFSLRKLVSQGDSNAIKTTLNTMLSMLPASLSKTDTWRKILNRSKSLVETNVIPMIKDLVATYSKKINSKGLEFSFSIEANTALCICHPNLLMDAMSNLLENAIKYNSPQGSIRIRVYTGIKKEKFQTDVPSIFISVQDTGIGIPFAEQKKVFEPGYRASNVGKVKGQGVGLDEVQNSVLSMKGHIDLFSESGNGSTFTIDLPLATK